MKPAELSFFSYSQLSTFEGCARKHHFIYHKHWRSDTPAPALSFGKSWGLAMDEVWSAAQEAPSEQSVVHAGWEAFMDTWDSSLESPPRTAHTAYSTLTNYVSRYWSFFKRIDLLASERRFAIPLSDTVWYIGLVDKVILDHADNCIYGIDHKTTTQYAKEGFFRSSFLRSFSPNSQIDGYQYALSLLYPSYKHFLIDATLVHKTVHSGFARIPCYASSDALAEWKADTLQQALNIKAAPISGWRNTRACHDYGGCQFLDLCRSSFSSIQRSFSKQPPPGFHVDERNSLEHLGISEAKLAKLMEASQ